MYTQICVKFLPEQDVVNMFTNRKLSALFVKIREILKYNLFSQKVTMLFKLLETLSKSSIFNSPIIA